MNGHEIFTNFNLNFFETPKSYRFYYFLPLNLLNDIQYKVLKLPSMNHLEEYFKSIGLSLTKPSSKWGHGMFTNSNLNYSETNQNRQI